MGLKRLAAGLLILALSACAAYAAQVAVGPGPRADVVNAGNSLALQTLNASVSQALNYAQGSTSIEVTNITGSGATLTVEVQGPAASAWYAKSMTGTLQSTITTDGKYNFTTNFDSAIRVRVSTTGATQNATVSIRESSQPGTEDFIRAAGTSVTGFTMPTGGTDMAGYLSAIAWPLGTPADTQWSGSGNGSITAILKKMDADFNTAAANTNPIPAKGDVADNTAQSPAALETGGVYSPTGWSVGSLTAGDKYPFTLDVNENLNVDIAAGISSLATVAAQTATQVTVGGASSSGKSAGLAGLVYNSSPITISSGSGAALQGDTNGYLYADLKAAPFMAASGAAVPSDSIFSGAEGSGNLNPLISCDGYAFANISSATDTQLVALSSGKSIYVCGYKVYGPNTNQVFLESATAASCGGTKTAIDFNIPVSSTDPGLVDHPSNFYGGFKVPASDALCVNSNATGAVGVGAWYTVQ